MLYLMQGGLPLAMLGVGKGELIAQIEICGSAGKPVLQLRDEIVIGTVRKGTIS
jgi:hypothetical protein